MEKIAFYYGGDWSVALGDACQHYAAKLGQREHHEHHSRTRSQAPAPRVGLRCFKTAEQNPARKRWEQEIRVQGPEPATLQQTGAPAACNRADKASLYKTGVMLSWMHSKSCKNGYHPPVVFL